MNAKDYISALRQCAKEHKKDITPTFQIRVSDLCNDTANLLENDVIEREKVKNLIKIAIEDAWELDYALEKLKEI